MPIGTYEMSVTAPGFKKAVRTGIEVAALTTFRVDFALESGSATESVSISAEAPLPETESGELSHNVSTDTLNSIPILTIGSDAAGVRNPLAADSLLPGASFASDAVLRVNGLPSSSQCIRIEGKDATSGFWKEVNSGNPTGAEAVGSSVLRQTVRRLCGAEGLGDNADAYRNAFSIAFAAGMNLAAYSKCFNPSARVSARFHRSRPRSMCADALPGARRRALLMLASASSSLLCQNNTQPRFE
jgi:hypothetical protein